MSKTITLRVSEEEYAQISSSAKTEHRPISNFITHTVLNAIANAFYADEREMAEIRTNSKLMKQLQRGHADAKAKRGQFVG